MPYWFVLLGSDLVFLCPGSGQESREVLAVALPVRQFAEHILHPCSRVDPCSPAGAYEGVYDGCPICGGVVAAEEIVLPAESQRPDGILDEVVVDVDPAVYSFLMKSMPSMASRSFPFRREDVSLCSHGRYPLLYNWPIPRRNHVEAPLWVCVCL